MRSLGERCQRGGILIRLQGIYQTSLPSHPHSPPRQSTQTGAVAGPQHTTTHVISASDPTAHNESSTTRCYQDHLWRTRRSTQTLEPCVAVSSASRLHAHIYLSSSCPARRFLRPAISPFFPRRLCTSPNGSSSSCSCQSLSSCATSTCSSEPRKGLPGSGEGSATVRPASPHILDISICAST